MPQKINPDTLDIEQLNLYKDRAVAMRNTGMILTLAGGTVIITSFVLFYGSMISVPIWEWDDTHNSAYSILAFCGGASTIAGIPLWIIGGSRKTKAELSLQKYTIVPLNSTVTGLGITLRF
ncbi:MAG: hypothetical protein JXN62_02060 [Bacteroidales bacterium]|nr:hypothetical protein [Bacteroidales bacterium]